MSIMDFDLLPKFYEEQDGMSSDIIRSLPWRHFPMFKHRGDVDIKRVENHVLTQLMQQDEWLLEVNKKSLAQIMQRKNSLELCNQYLGEFSHSLNMANMHLHQSQESMKKAKGGEEEDCFAGLVGGFHLVEAWDERTNDLELDRLLHSCTDLLQQEERLQQKIDDFGNDTTQYMDIIDAARVFSFSAQQDEQLSRVEALQDLRERATHVLATFEDKIKLLLQRHLTKNCISCKYFSNNKYWNLLQAMICIRHEKEDEPNVEVSWVEYINSCLKTEANKCLARALLDPTNGKDSDYDKDLVRLAYTLRQGDDFNLESVISELTTIRYDFESAKNYFPLVFHRLCFLLTNVLLCHYFLAQIPSTTPARRYRMKLTHSSWNQPLESLRRDSCVEKHT